MMSPRGLRNTGWALLAAALFSLNAGCECYFPFLPFFPCDGVTQAGGITGSATTTAFTPGAAYTEDLIQERTFTNGTSVTTVTYPATDKTRVPLGVDFNGDGRIDPVVGYGFDQAVIQILLSRPTSSNVDPISLTLDSKRDMEDLADVAVGDIDGDGFLDIVAGANNAVWYFHHPSSGNTTDLPAWGVQDPNDSLRERIDGSFMVVSQDEVAAILAQATGGGFNPGDYVITAEQIYTNVELADFDNDNDLDVAASRSFVINATPRENVPAEAFQIVDGDVLILVNPGFAPDGKDWLQVSVGAHERQQRLDRDGASGLLVIDMDGDGWLDVISAARDDNNAQIAWFRNPGLPLTTANPWTQYRIGSVRDAWSIDIGDVTGDAWPDVVAAGGEQKQVVLFQHPAVPFPDDRYLFDWETHPIVTFDAFEPRDVKLLDLDLDGGLELVVGATGGAIRFFEPPLFPTAPWAAGVVTDIEGGGDVGLLGFGDLDGDGDLDLVAVVSAADSNDSRTVWVRNERLR